MTDSTRSCPDCGSSLPADAPGGLCPRCLMGAGIDRTAEFRPVAPPKVGLGTQVATNYHGFRSTLVELGLVEESDLDGLAARAGEDVQALAKELVKAKKITPYQAGALAQGKAKGLLIGDYLVLDKLGAGGMGVVFRARHRRNLRIVALKILPPSFAREPETVRRFRREFRVAAHLNHPNLVAAIEASEDRGVHFLTMDYVQGRDLETLVGEDGPLSVKLALHCVIQIARGLEAAHGQGVIHRDVKPANVMIDAAGNVRVCDLGLARVIEATSHLGKEVGPSLTQTGSYMGSVDFLAPEQADDAKKADHRADIYSLGCTLYFLLTGHPPFPGETMLKRLIAHQERPAPSIRDHRPEVPPALEAVYQRMMVKRPEGRPATMTDVVAALESCRSSPREAGDASADLKAFATTFMKRAAPKKPGPDASVFARPKEARGLMLEPGLNLEDLITDYRPEVPRGEIPEEKLPPIMRRARPPKRRGRGPRPMAPLTLAALFGLVAGVVGIYLMLPEPAKGPGVEPIETDTSGAPVVPPLPPLPRIAGFRPVSGPGGEYPSIVASRAARPPVADGVIGPGEYKTVIRVDFRSGSVFGKMMGGMPDPAKEKAPEDLSLDIHAAYTERALHLAFRVRDQFIDADEADAKAPFLNDCVELFFDGDGAVNDFAFSKAGPRGSREGFQIGADAEGRKFTVASDFDNNDWKAAGKRAEGGYVVEFEIPLALIDTVDGEGVAAPGAGSLIRMGLAVDDLDTAKNGPRAFGYLRAREGVESPFLGREAAWQMGVWLEPAATSGAGGESIASGGFVPLFNGKDLSGWKTHPSQPGDWKVAGGLLIGEGKGPSHLYTERGDYTDFRLRWEFRVNAAGNSGVHLRSPFGPTYPVGSPRYPGGYEAAIYYGSAAPMRTGALFAASDRAVEVADSHGAPGEWVKMEATVRGDRVTVRVNGQVTADYTDPERTFRSGHIALQCHADDTRVEFRSIEIEELASEAGPTREEPLGEIIYKDDFGDVNSGWQRNEVAIEGSTTPFRRDYDSGVYFLEAPANWTSFEGWNCTGPLDQEFEYEAVARSVGPEGAYGAFAMILMGPEGRGFRVSINPGGKLAIYDSPWVEAGEQYFEPFTHPAIKGGEQWNTVTIRLRRRSMEVLVNGQAACPPIATDYDLLPSTPQIGIVKGDATRIRAEFDRVAVRALPAATRPPAGGPPARIVYTEEFQEVLSGWHRGRTGSDDGLSNNTSDYADGIFHMLVEPDWQGTSMSGYMMKHPMRGEFQVDVVGRIVGEGNSGGAWGTMIVRDQGRGVHVMIDRAAQLRIIPAFRGLKKFPNDRSFGPISHPAIRPADQWNTLTLRVRERRVEILVNGTAVCEPFAVDYDLLPAHSVFGVTKPDLGTRVQAEFDRLQVRLLP